MAGVLKAVAVLPSTNGKPEDAVFNDFYFITNGTPPYAAAVTQIDSMITEFYNNNWLGGSDKVCGVIGSSISRTASVNIRYFDITTVLNGAAAGSPFTTTTFTLGDVMAGTTQYPRECAIVVTYHADYGTAPEFGPVEPRPPDLPPSTKPYKPRPRQSLRGRLYIGPINNAYTAFDSNNDPLISTTGRDLFAAASAGLVAASDADATWAQWSRRQARVEPVTGGFIDNDYDTQRRRGVKSGARTIWP